MAYLENYQDSTEKSTFSNIYNRFYKDEHNEFMEFGEYDSGVSQSYSNPFMNNIYSYSENNENKHLNFDIEEQEEEKPLFSSKTSRFTEIILEKVETKTVKETIFKIEKVTKEIKILKQKRNRSKNKRNNNNNGEKKHTKYAFDNIASKIRTSLFKGILVVLNKSLEDDQYITREEKVFTSQSVGRIETRMRDKSFYKINISEYGYRVQGNLDLLKMPLRQILYQDCSKKYKNYQNNNKKLLNEISNNNTFNKTNKIFDMTFLQCLEHYRGQKKYDVLDGLENEYKSLLREFERKGEEKEYIEQFKSYLNNYEKNFQSKKSYKCQSKKVIDIKK